MILDLDKWLEWTNDCKYLPENDLKVFIFILLFCQHLCDYVAEILIEEPNIIHTYSPITICGDIHGQVFILVFNINLLQFYDVKELFNHGGQIPDRKYIFMVDIYFYFYTFYQGDFVDRGFYSLETWTRLIVLKAKFIYSFYFFTFFRYPDHIYLIRGNHESRGITQSYGFYGNIK